MEKYLNDTVKTIQELIRIDSTNQPAEEGMPFGKGAARALQAGGLPPAAAAKQAAAGTPFSKGEIYKELIK